MKPYFRWADEWSLILALLLALVLVFTTSCLFSCLPYSWFTLVHWKQLPAARKRLPPKEKDGMSERPKTTSVYVQGTKPTSSCRNCGRRKGVLLLLWSSREMRLGWMDGSTEHWTCNTFLSQVIRCRRFVRHPSRLILTPRYRSLWFSYKNHVVRFKKKEKKKGDVWFHRGQTQVSGVKVLWVWPSTQKGLLLWKLHTDRLILMQTSVFRRQSVPWLNGSTRHLGNVNGLRL